jgi:hypothetical protein
VRRPRDRFTPGPADRARRRSEVDGRHEACRSPAGRLLADVGGAEEDGGRACREEEDVDIRYQVVAIDAAEPAPVSTFWAWVLEGTVDAEDDWRMVMGRDGVSRIGVHLAPDHVCWHRSLAG